MDQLVSTLQGQLPLFAVLGLIDIDEFAEESALPSELGNQLGTLLIGLLETEAVALIIAGQNLYDHAVIWFIGMMPGSSSALRAYSFTSS